MIQINSTKITSSIKHICSATLGTKKIIKQPESSLQSKRKKINRQLNLAPEKSNKATKNALLQG